MGATKEANGSKEPLAFLYFNKYSTFCGKKVEYLQTFQYTRREGSKTRFAFLDQISGKSAVKGMQIFLQDAKIFCIHPGNIFRCSCF